MFKIIVNAIKDPDGKIMVVTVVASIVATFGYLVITCFGG